MNELKGSQSRAQLGVLRQRTVREECLSLPGFCLSFAHHTFVSLRRLSPNYVDSLSHVAPCCVPLCPLLGKWGYSFCVTVFLLWIQTVSWALRMRVNMHLPALPRFIY